MTNNNTSATGGYLFPSQPGPLPGNLSFEDFVQSIFVGVSGLPGDLVRPRWQIDPPKQPDVTIDWLSIALSENEADTNAFVGLDPTGNNILERMEALTVECAFYGPNGFDFASTVRDNLQIKQNLAVLQSANMNFVNTGRMVRAPDLVNERWVNRWQMSVYLRRQILKTYPILDLLKGPPGTLYINNQGSGVKTLELGAQ